MSVKCKIPDLNLYLKEGDNQPFEVFSFNKKKKRKVRASLIQHFSDTDANNNVRPTKRQNPWANFLRYGVRESSDSGQQGNTTVHLH